MGGDFFQILLAAHGGVLIAIRDVSGMGMPAGDNCPEHNSIVHLFIKVGYDVQDSEEASNRDLRMGMIAPPMNAKSIKRLLALAIGAGCAWAVSRWPANALPIQMALYTTMVMVPLGFGTWSERNRDRFWLAIVAAVILHGTVLYAIHSIFPFHQIWPIIPLALLEASVLFMLTLRIVGDNCAQPE